MDPAHWNRSFALVLILALASLASPGSADLYEWTDESGRTHYSNSPRPGAKRVGLAPIALGQEAGAEESPTDEARRARLQRQRAERLVDSHELYPAAGMDETPGALQPAPIPIPPPSTPEPKVPSLIGDPSPAPMVTE